MAGADPRFPEERASRQTVAARIAPQQSTSIGRPAPAPRPRPVAKANSGGSYSRPTAPPAATAGPIQDINAYLGGDTGYQQQLAQLGQTMSDFTADTTRRRGSLETEYGLSDKALKDQRGLDLDTIEDDYGARGMLTSGLYADAVGKYEKEFGQRVSDLSRRQQEALAAIAQETTQYGSQQKLKEQEAMQAAIARRAAMYGV